MAVDVKGAVLMRVRHRSGLRADGLRRLEEVRVGRADDRLDVQKLRDSALDHGGEQDPGAMGRGAARRAFPRRCRGCDRRPDRRAGPCPRRPRPERYRCRCLPESCSRVDGNGFGRSLSAWRRWRRARETWISGRISSRYCTTSCGPTRSRAERGNSSSRATSDSGMAMRPPSCVREQQHGLAVGGQPRACWPVSRSTHVRGPRRRRSPFGPGPGRRGSRPPCRRP